MWLHCTTTERCAFVRLLTETLLKNMKLNPLQQSTVLEVSCLPYTSSKSQQATSMTKKMSHSEYQIISAGYSDRLI